jgi:hypothetical protein
MNALDESTIKEEPVGEKAGKEVMKDQSVVTGDKIQHQQFTQWKIHQLVKKQ